MAIKTLLPKSEARKLVLERRNKLSSADVKDKTDRIIKKLALTDEFNYAKKIHIYIPRRENEVDTKKIISHALSAGKQVFIPKLNKETKTFTRFHFTDWDQIVKNRDGYWEPIIGYDEDLSDIDLIFVPATAVSALGQRVGSGGGYYDNLLRGIYAKKIVVAFEIQIFENIETERHDVRVDKIITELRIINTREKH